MRRLALCLLLSQAISAFAGTNALAPFPNFIDILILSEQDGINIYLEGGRKDSIPALQASIDDLPMQKRREGALLRFDPERVPLNFAVETAESIYRCAVPVIYLFDSTGQYSSQEITENPYLFGLSRMPKYNKFLRVLDIGSFLLLPAPEQQPRHTPVPSRAGPITGSLLVAVLAMGFYAAGLHISRLRRPWWIAGYVIPIALTAIIAVARWVPTLEMRMPFRLLMSERREYIIMSIATALLLSIPAARVGRRVTAVLVTAFAALFVIHFSLLPYLLPAFNRAELRSLKTHFDNYGVCLQSTGYTCGPAAAVSALREFDIAAEEGVLAVFSYSTSSAGTPPELLCRAMMKLYKKDGIECEFRAFDRAADLKEVLPVLAVVKFGFLVDHYVTVLRVTDDYITVADPAQGMRVLSVEEFESNWRRQGITVRRRADSTEHGGESASIKPAA